MISEFELERLIPEADFPGDGGVRERRVVDRDLRGTSSVSRLCQLLDRVTQEAVAFCVRVEAESPFCTIEEGEHAISQELRPVISALEATLAHLDQRLGPRGPVGRANGGQ
jgi:hypothetical protein